jgi:prepilin-type N-terminal cleavage/methylation domain-containing protein
VIVRREVIKYRRDKNAPTRRGFTLIELMIVIGIVGLLASIAIPAYQKYALRAHFAERSMMVAAIERAILTYHGEHDELPNQSSAGRLIAWWNPRFSWSSGGQLWFADPNWSFIGAPKGRLYFRYGAEGNSRPTDSWFCIYARGDLDADMVLSSYAQCWHQNSAVGAFKPQFSSPIVTPPGIY